MRETQHTEWKELRREDCLRRAGGFANAEGGGRHPAIGRLPDRQLDARNTSPGIEAMSEEPLPQSEIILYQTEDGRTRIQCRS